MYSSSLQLKYNLSRGPSAPLFLNEKIMAINRFQPERQGGRCFDPQTRQWRRCGDAASTNVSPFSQGGDSPLGCCLGPNCCLTCEEIGKITRCFFYQSLASYNIDPPLTTPAGPDLRMIRSLLTAGTLFGAECDEYTLEVNSDYTEGRIRRKNGTYIDCYKAVGGLINENKPLTNGEIFPSVLILKPTSPSCDLTIGIAFLFQAIAENIDFRLLPLGVKYCINPYHIFTEEAYRNQCEDCQNQYCTFLVGIPGVGGGPFFGYNMGILSPTNNRVRFFLSIPYCCRTKVNMSDFKIVETTTTGFTIQLTQPEFVGVGYYFFDIILNPSIIEPGSHSIELTIQDPRCLGIARLVLRFTVE